jgi:hypothetical protein
MSDLFQQIFLSNIMIFMVMGFILLLVTWWMASLREFAGYALGWLFGIFLIIVLETLIGDSGADEFVEDVELRLNFLTLMIPSALGLAAGFGILMVIRMGGQSNSRLVRALMIAGLVSFVLVSWYLMLLTTYQTRLLIGIFVLTFAIGALFSFILTRSTSLSQYVTNQNFSSTGYQGNDPLNSLNMGDPIQPINPPPATSDFTVQQRVQTLRERMRRRE